MILNVWTNIDMMNFILISFTFISFHNSLVNNIMISITYLKTVKMSILFKIIFKNNV